jgi:hypothetical protein
VSRLPRTKGGRHISKHGEEMAAKVGLPFQDPPVMASQISIDCYFAKGDPNSYHHEECNGKAQFGNNPCGCPCHQQS